MSAEIIPFPPSISLYLAPMYAERHFREARQKMLEAFHEVIRTGGYPESLHEEAVATLNAMRGLIEIEEMEA
ncbi:MULTISPECIES: hypothetical protein [Komagataeibacter]|uniref:Uncharacterized protein n=1 Tax=Komagataeibacter intermedius NRIC 0521 TaxID=1307934 RepID=A0ABQ0PHH1_9PROT|nr:MULTISPECIES: hypothetical protein [Komagataeibacter]GAN86367.1 hypothetical protein Gain_0027_042 [Komagataeibacter intermedius TF2]GBQ67996.1 hypothetical protein AA0521_1125 [Komagataeibacter intermedius NRIC 0521]